MTANNLDIKLANNPLIYRSLLTIPKKVNFGLEIELDNVDYDDVYRLVGNQFGSEWQVKEDKSLTLGKNAEIVSPVLQNTKQTWILLKKMGKLLNYLKPTYDKCSFQINFDSDILPTSKDRVRFLKLYAVYEDIIYRFSKGEDSKYRESLETYASPIILYLRGLVKFDDDTILESLSNNKRYGVIFKTKNKDLIEFRTPNSTSNPILWQNYITFFYYLLVYAINNKCNEKELDQYIDNFCKTYLLEYYENYHEEKAIKLSNMIFSNNIDQLFFMNQYKGR